MSLTIGCHLSSSRGYRAMGRQIQELGGNTFQFFTRNPRGSKAKDLDPEDVALFLSESDAAGIHRILAHAPYTLNPCSADPHVREFARIVMADDLERMEATPGNCYNFHPGSHVKQGVDVGIDLIIDHLNDILKPEQHTTVLLETMSGKGSEVGGSFQELRRIIDGVVLQEHMGVCLDTCHIWDAGYDIVQDLDSVLDQFDEIIGLQRLKAIHMNDSKNPRGSHKDRHEKIGKGYIGAEAMIRILNHPRLQGIPVYLETPNEPEGYAEEIAFLKGQYQG